MSQNLKLRMVPLRWLQELAKICGVPYNRLLMALRGEEGELNGRFHFHCLVGGTATRNYHTLEHQAEWLWKIQCRCACRCSSI